MEKLIELQPVKETTEEFEALEQEIKRLFKKEVYFPILKELGNYQDTIQNAADDEFSNIVKALRSGRITYSLGTFSGRFDAETSKELRRLGAQWSRKTRTFKAPLSTLPPELRSTVSAGEEYFKAKLARIDEKLSKILPEKISEKLKASNFFDRTLWKTEKNLKASLKPVTFLPKLSKESVEKISKEWQTNMQLDIKTFAEKEILSLRAKIKTHVFSGNRYETIIDTIKKSYNVTENKAKFLARQETQLLVTKFKESRYLEAGVKEYKWACVAGSKNHPVRAWHKSLEGKIFTWDNPPITTKPGEPVRRNNPGQDFNCRCFALPVVRFKS